MEEKIEVFVIGKMNLNGKKAPFIEVILDTADGRADGEIILLKQVAAEDNDYYMNKIRS